MDWVMLWFILAGFVLGFAISTVWEWIYFRIQRSRWYEDRIAELEDELMRYENANTHTVDSERASGKSKIVPSGEEPSYRSPGVFLDVEQTVSTPGSEIDPISESSISGVQSPPFGRPIRNREEMANRPQHFDSDDNLSRPPHPIQPAVVADSMSRPSTTHQTATSNTVRQDGSEQIPQISTTPVQTEAVGRGSLLGSMLRHEQGDTAYTSDSSGYADDLTKITGVGEVCKQRLYEANIFTWHQVAQTTVDELRQITKARRNATVENWPQLAQRLAEMNNRVNAVYAGPIPDDLTKINGIGPAYSQQLQEAGIHTYQQLAMTPLGELAQIIVVPAVGEEVNYEKWVQDAAQFDQIKRIEKGSMR